MSEEAKSPEGGRPKRQASQKAAEKITATEAPEPKQPKKAKSEAKKKEPKEKKEEHDPNDHGLAWATIPVGDLERAQKFYSTVFGWKFDPWKDTAVLFVSSPSKGRNQQIRGHFEQSAERLAYPCLWVGVQSIDEHLKIIQEHGGSTVAEKTSIAEHVGLQAVFKDSEGNLLKLYEASH